MGPLGTWPGGPTTIFIPVNSCHKSPGGIVLPGGGGGGGGGGHSAIKTVLLLGT